MKYFVPVFLPLILSTAFPAVAVPLVTEGFDYTPPGALIAGQNGGAGWTGSWTESTLLPTLQDTITTGLSHPGLETTGGALKLTISSQDQRDFNILDATNGETTWVSFLLRSDNVTFSSGDIFYLALRPNDTRPSPAFGVFYNPDTAKNVWGIGNQGTGGLTPVYSNVEFVTQTTYLIVASITWNTASREPETVRMFLNPNPATAPNATSAIAERSMQIGTNATTSNRIRRVFILAGDSTESSQWTLDELRIARDFEAVLQIPEPATASLALLGTLFAFSKRRRKAAKS